MEKKTHPVFTCGVANDGRVIYTPVATYLAEVYMLRSAHHGYDIKEAEGQRWVEFTVDNGATDLLVRLPVEVIAQLHEACQEDDDQQGGTQ